MSQEIISTSHQTLEPVTLRYDKDLGSFVINFENKDFELKMFSIKSNEGFMNDVFKFFMWGGLSTLGLGLSIVAMGIRIGYEICVLPEYLINLFEKNKTKKQD